MRLASVALVGCGHIGGSLALALRRAGVARSVVGLDRDPAAAARALERGICDGLLAGLDEARAADLVVLATPVRAIAGMAAALAGAPLVTDVGSTKAAIVRAFDGAGVRFVGGHPLAGTERAGPDAADPDLFRGRRVFLTPTERTDPAALAAASELWRAAGAEVSTIGADEHDRIMAAVSHLPHVAAYALAAVVGAQAGVAGLSGGGFADTTRVASTPPAMWIDILIENREAVLPLVDALGARLEALRAAIDAGDAEALAALLTEGRAARARVLAA